MLGFGGQAGSLLQGKGENLRDIVGRKRKIHFIPIRSELSDNALHVQFANSKNQHLEIM